MLEPQHTATILIILLVEHLSCVYPTLILYIYVYNIFIYIQADGTGAKTPKMWPHGREFLKS